MTIILSYFENKIISKKASKLQYYHVFLSEIFLEEKKEVFCLPWLFMICWGSSIAVCLIRSVQTGGPIVLGGAIKCEKGKYQLAGKW